MYTILFNNKPSIKKINTKITFISPTCTTKRINSNNISSRFSFYNRFRHSFNTPIFFAINSNKIITIIQIETFANSFDNSFNNLIICTISFIIILINIFIYNISISLLGLILFTQMCDLNIRYTTIFYSLTIYLFEKKK